MGAAAFGLVLLSTIFGPAAEAEDPANVAVRAGIHPDYTRLVFDWAEAPGFEVSATAEGAKVTFGRSGRADLAAVAQSPPRWVLDIRELRAAPNLEIALALAPNSEARAFALGPKVVVDIRQTAKPPATGTPVRSPAPAVPSAGAAARPARSPLLTFASLAEEAEPWGKPWAAKPDLDTILVTAVATTDGLRLEFPWQKEAGAAVFRRGNALWVVFDEAANFELAPALEAASGRLESGIQLAVERGAVLRFRIAGDLHPIVRRLDLTWLVDLGPEQLAPERQIEVTRTSRADAGAVVFLPVPGAFERVDVRDPEIGDTLQVVPLRADARGVPEARRFVEFEILETVQGVAVRPISDAVHVHPRRSGVEVRGDEGLVLSSASLPNAFARAVAASEGATTIGTGGQLQTPRLVDFAAWRKAPGGNIREQRSALLAAASMTTDGDRRAARWRLARFLTAHGYAPEAEAVLEVVEGSDPRAATDRSFRLMKGIVLFMLGRADEAMKILSGPDLASNSHAALWRALIHAERHHWEEARADFTLGGDALSSYPPDIRPRFHLTAARAAIALRDTAMAEVQLAILDAEELSPAIEAETALNRGRFKAARGDYRDAAEEFERALASGTRPIRAWADLERTMALRATRDISVREAIRRLEMLRFSWRGDDFELALLRALGAFYIESEAHRDGLEVMRQAVTHLPDYPETRDIARDMDKVFARLFLDGDVASEDPVGALALYNDFPELTPVGREGDEMIRRLADRLVAVDLLDKAAELLEHQIEFRLEGVAKAQVATRLAVIYLLDHRPGKVLDIMGDTRQTRLPQELAQQRRRLEARALADLERHGEALSLLEGDRSSEAAQLREEINWGAGNWAEAARLIENRLAGLGLGEGAPSSDAAREDVMRLAVALAMGGDGAGLARVRTRFAEAMEKGPDATAFDIVTRESDARGKEFRDVARSVAEVSTIEAFLAGYRRKVEAGGLRAIN